MTFLRSHERQNYYFNISTLILQQKFPLQNQIYFFFFANQIIRIFSYVLVLRSQITYKCPKDPDEKHLTSLFCSKRVFVLPFYAD